MGMPAPGPLSSPGRPPVFSRRGRTPLALPMVLGFMAVALLLAPGGLPGPSARSASSAPTGLPNTPFRVPTLVRGAAPGERTGRAPAPSAPRTAPSPAVAPVADPRGGDRTATLRASGGDPAADWYNVSAESTTTLPVVEFTQGTYDAADGYLLVFGGDNYTDNLGSTWAYADGNWTRLNASDVPGTLSGANLAYDPNASEVVLYGGVRSFSPVLSNNTTYTYRDGRWTAWNLTPAPPPRVAGCMAYDPLLGGVVLFGGTTTLTTGPSYFNDLWLFEKGGWTELASGSTPPSPRWQGQMAYDPTLGGLLLYGGISEGGTALGDSWLYKDGNWSRLAPTSSPPALSDAALDFDPALGTLVLAGGLTGSGSLSDATYTFNGTTWSALSTTDLPSSHDAGIGVYDPEDRAFVLAAGSPSGSFTDLLSGPIALNVSLPAGADANAPFQLTATASGGAPPFTDSFSIDWGDGTTAAGGPGGFSHVYTAAGLFDVTVSADQTSGYAAAWNGTILVRLPPTVIAASSAPGGDAGLPINLTASATGGWPPITYVWDLGAGALGYGPAVEYAYPTAGTYSVEVWANDSVGGSASTNLSLAIVAPPTVSVPTLGFRADAGVVARFSLPTSGGTPPFSVTWTYPNGSTSTGVTTAHLFPSATSGSLGIVLFDAAGATVRTSAPLTVAAALTVAVTGPSTLTAGSTGTWTAEVTGGTPPYAYAWTLPDGSNGSAATVRHLFSGATGPEPIDLVVTDALGATAGAQANVSVRLSSSGNGPFDLPLPETIGLFAAAVVICGAGLWAFYGRRPKRPAAGPGTGRSGSSGPPGSRKPSG